MDTQLKDFVEGIVDQKNIAGVNAEVKEQLVADLTEKLMDEINRALIAALPDEKAAELDAMLDANADTAAIQSFIANSGINVAQITLGTLTAFRGLYLGDKV